MIAAAPAREVINKRRIAIPFSIAVRAVMPGTRKRCRAKPALAKVVFSVNDVEARSLVNRFLTLCNGLVTNSRNRELGKFACGRSQSDEAGRYHALRWAQTSFSGLSSRARNALSRPSTLLRCQFSSFASSGLARSAAAARAASAASSFNGHVEVGRRGIERPPATRFGRCNGSGSGPGSRLG